MNVSARADIRVRLCEPSAAIRASARGCVHHPIVRCAVVGDPCAGAHGRCGKPVQREADRVLGQRFLKHTCIWFMRRADVGEAIMAA